MGFFFNNAAIGAEHLIRRHGLHILIVDWDLHHGSRTERTFYERQDVLYVSTHQSPLYPGTGAARFFGHGEGYGYNLNIPLLAGKTDADFLHIFEKILAPVAAGFAPEFILSSAGFDIAAGDPLGGMEMTADGFGLLTASLMAMAERTAKGRLALVLEGGYDLPALRDGVREVLKALDRRIFPDQTHPPSFSISQVSPGAPGHLPQDGTYLSSVLALETVPFKDRIGHFPPVSGRSLGIVLAQCHIG
jgi:acetoin utilization deacetylase AcuC-like enzyme